jgi:DNA-binding transcriptional MocR family regulator
MLERKADSIRHANEPAILQDRLKPGEALPTARTLAVDLGINKKTVVATYRQLQQTGLVVSDGRRGSIVASQSSHERSLSVGSSGRQAVSVRDGNPDVAFLPDAADIRDAIARKSLDNHLYGGQRNQMPFGQSAMACFTADNVKVDRGIFVSAGDLEIALS